MDNLTHTLTGLMISRVIPRSVTRAGLLLMVAANAPDIDVFWSVPGGTAHYLHYHRGLTHSLALSPLMALLAVAIVWLVERRKDLPWGWLFFYAWVGVLSHLGLDWTNMYGIRMYLPFSSEWLRLDTVNVVDFFIWAILLLGVAAPALGKLVNSEIGAKSGRGTGWAVTTLLLLSTYEGGRWMAHDRAIQALNSRIYETGSPVHVTALPMGAGPFTWKGVVETSGAYTVFAMDLRNEFDPASGRVFYKAEPSPAIEVARKSEGFQRVLAYSTHPFWRVTSVSDPEGGSKVQLFDMRWGTPNAPGLEAAAIVDAAGRIRDEKVEFGQVIPR